MSERPQHYILNGHTPVAVDMLTWARWFNIDGNRRVARTWIDYRCFVSTIFLGLDHGFGGGEPLVYETLVFGGPLAGHMVRYATWDDAERGHEQVCKEVQHAITTNSPEEKT